MRESDELILRSKWRERLVEKHGADHTFLYNSKYDASYCSDCNVWIESMCSDQDCEFCSRRPPDPTKA
jgi:hypothetical protein